MINFLHLKYAIEVAKTGSISKAAENLFVNQPNLSRAIKDLEETLGTALFDRTAKGMLLTPKGEEFVEYAKSVINQVNEIENIFINKKEKSLGFSISVPRASYISEAFAQFSKKLGMDKPSEIFYKETNSQRAINNILHADYKLGIVRYASVHDKYFKRFFDEKELSYELITEFRYVLLFSENHKLAGKSEISFSDLRTYKEIAHGDKFVPSLSAAAVKKDELPGDTNKRIYVFERASQFDLLSTDENTFMWVSPVPTETLKRYKLLQRKCQDNEKVFNDVLIYRNNYKLTEADKLFIAELNDAKEKYLL